jgi:hypothetical protein
MIDTNTEKTAKTKMSPIAVCTTKLFTAAPCEAAARKEVNRGATPQAGCARFREFSGRA